MQGIVIYIQFNSIQFNLLLYQKSLTRPRARIIMKKNL